MKKSFTFLLVISATFTVQAQFTWHQIQTPTQQKLRTIQFISNEVGFVGGDSVLLKTIDGGLNWAEVQIDSIPINSWQRLDIFDMHWFNEDHGMIMSGVWSGGFETFDGGANWEVMNFAHNGFCQTTSLFFFDENNGFAGGAGCFEGHIIDRFSNGTWNETIAPQNWNSQGWVSSIEFKDANLGLAGTVDGHLLRTTDSGLNWDSIPNVAGDSAITDFIFYTDGTIRATHHNNQYGVMISTDNGLTWEHDIETATFFYPDMNAAHLDGNGITYLGGAAGFGYQGVIFENHGGSWNWGTVEHPINDIASHSDSITFLVGDSGAIYASTLPSSVGIQDVVRVDFEIAPNPATDVMRVSSMAQKMTGYEVIDLVGRTVARSEAAFGESLELDVSHLKSGAYTLKLQTESGIGAKRFVKN